MRNPDYKYPDKAAGDMGVLKRPKTNDGWEKNMLPEIIFYMLNETIPEHRERINKMHSFMCSDINIRRIDALMDDDTTPMGLLVTHFGSQKNIASAMDVATSCVSVWFKKKNVPPGSALLIEQLTKGKIKALDICDPVFKRPNRKYHRRPLNSDI